MKIERLELRLLKLPLVHFFETSFGRIDDKHFILVRVDGDGATGYGECVAEQDPYYSSETNETVWHIIADFIAPRVLGVEFAHPRDVFPALKAIRGHNMAKAAVEMAAWDLFARQRGEPLAPRPRRHARPHRLRRVDRHPADRSTSSRRRWSASSPPAIGASRSRSSRAGTSPPVETVRARFGAIPLMVDANAAYTLADADHLAAARSRST